MEKEHKNKTHSHPLGIVSQLNKFHMIASNSSPHTIHRVYYLESISLLPKRIVNNMIFLFQKCDSFDRTAKGRTWLDSQDHPEHHRLTNSELSKK